jgi:hypothetical protein
MWHTSTFHDADVLSVPYMCQTSCCYCSHRSNIAKAHQLWAPDLHQSVFPLLHTLPLLHERLASYACAQRTLRVAAYQCAPNGVADSLANCCRFQVHFDTCLAVCMAGLAASGMSCCQDQELAGSSPSWKHPAVDCNAGRDGLTLAAARQAPRHALLHCGHCLLRRAAPATPGRHLVACDPACT